MSMTEMAMICLLGVAAICVVIVQVVNIVQYAKMKRAYEHILLLYDEIDLANNLFAHVFNELTDEREAAERLGSALKAMILRHECDEDACQPEKDILQEFGSQGQWISKPEHHLHDTKGSP
jgi:hypothetical protein